MLSKRKKQWFSENAIMLLFDTLEYIYFDDTKEKGKDYSITS